MSVDVACPPAAQDSARYEPLRVMLVDDSVVIRGLIARWIEAEPEALKGIRWYQGARLVEDTDGRPVALFDGDWSLNYMTENNPRLRFVDIAAEEFETADERR